MDDRNAYTNTNELLADDQLSPAPTPDNKGTRPRRTNDAKSDGEDDEERIPRPATSE